MQEHVLVVEDAPEFQHLHRESLSKAGYRVSVAETGVRALEMARSFDPSVIILDLVLPDADGMDLCAEFRRFTDAYIIMVTSRSDEVDKLVGLAAGADDYMTKPFSSRELVARAGVLLRRPRGMGSSETTVRELGDLVVDPAAREVSLDGEPCSLTKIEFDILDALTEDTNLVRSPSMLSNGCSFRNSIVLRDLFVMLTPQPPPGAPGRSEPVSPAHSVSRDCRATIRPRT